MWLCDCAPVDRLRYCPEREVFAEHIATVPQLSDTLTVANDVISRVLLSVTATRRGSGATEGNRPTTAPAAAGASGGDTGARLASLLVRDPRVSAAGALFSQLLALSSRLPFVPADMFYNPVVSRVFAERPERVAWLLSARCDQRYQGDGKCCPRPRDGDVCDCLACWRPSATVAASLTKI